MSVGALQRALISLLWLAAWPVAAENARLPYFDIYRIQNAQAELGAAHSNLVLVLQMRSTQPTVKCSDITAFISSKSGNIPLTISADGSFKVPVRDDLLAEDPWIMVNQPKGTMQLTCYAGLAPSLVRPMTNAFRYATIMRAVRECDDVQERLRQFFPGSPRLMMTGIRLSFVAGATGPVAVVHAKSGERKLTADAAGDLFIPLDSDLLDEDPLVTLTERPVAVEVTSRKIDDAH
jgi:hypothetical protein